MSREIIDRLQIPDDLAKSLHEAPLLPPRQSDDRQYPRRHVVAKAVIEYGVGLPAYPRQPESHSVTVADLSRRGLRFLHSEQLFPGEQAAIKMAGGKQIGVEVARCRKIAEHCYEVGVKFTAVRTNDL
jgi:PilZ domain-containing protein